MSLNTTPRTWVASELVTAAMFNTEVRDAFVGVQASWTAYTPTLTNITLGNGVLTGRWANLGRTVYGTVDFTAGSTTTYGAGNLTFSLPTTALAGSGRDFGSGAVVPSGAGASRRLVMVQPASTTTVVLVYEGGTVTNVLPAAFGTASIINFLFEFEAP